MKATCAFIQVPIDLFDDTSLSASELLVLQALLTFTNRKKNTCWPSLRTIARRAKQSKRNISRILLSLECKGYIRKSSRFRDGTKERDSNTYKILRGSVTIAQPRDKMTAEVMTGEQEGSDIMAQELYSSEQYKVEKYGFPYKTIEEMMQSDALEVLMDKVLKKGRDSVGE